MAVGKHGVEEEDESGAPLPWPSSFLQSTETGKEREREEEEVVKVRP